MNCARRGPSAPPRIPDQAIFDAAWNAVAIASVRLDEELSTFRYVVRLAHEKGLSVSDLCWASGLGEESIRRYLDEVA